MSSSPHSRLSTRALLLLALLLTPQGCLPDSSGQECPYACQSGYHCNDSGDACVADLTAFLNRSDFSPLLDAMPLGDETHLLLYDRLGNRFIYSVQPAEGSLTWEGVAGVDGPVNWTPKLKLMGVDGRTWGIIESAPGKLSQIERFQDGWKTTTLASAESSLVSFDATYDSSQGLALCAADTSGHLFFGWRKPKSTFHFEEVQIVGSKQTPHAPCSVIISGGRVLLFAGGHPSGVLTLLRDDESGWKGSPLDELALPTDLKSMLLQGVPVAFYLDAATGALQAALGESGAASITQLDGSAADDSGGEQGSRFSIAKDPAHDLILVGYFDHVSSMLTVIAYQLEQDWVVVQKLSETPFSPVLVAYPSGAVSAFTVMEDSDGLGELAQFPLL